MSKGWVGGWLGFYYGLWVGGWVGGEVGGGMGRGMGGGEDKGGYRVMKLMKLKKKIKFTLSFTSRKKIFFLYL